MRSSLSFSLSITRPQPPSGEVAGPSKEAQPPLEEMLSEEELAFLRDASPPTHTHSLTTEGQSTGGGGTQGGGAGGPEAPQEKYNLSTSGDKRWLAVYLFVISVFACQEEQG